MKTSKYKCPFCESPLKRITRKITKSSKRKDRSFYDRTLKFECGEKVKRRITYLDDPNLSKKVQLNDQSLILNKCALLVRDKRLGELLDHIGY